MTELFVIEGEAKCWEDAIRQTSDVLLEKGCVKDDFYESCVKREKVYPTGLTEYCPVALPHTSKDHVDKQAICVLRLKEPVKFHSMEDIDKQVDVSIVLNLAFLDDRQHIVIISNIITSLKENDFVSNLLNAPIDEFKQSIRNKFLREE